MAASEKSMPFIKNLASSDRKLRTASLTSLETFLASRTELSFIDAQKLWKGLYYAHWMTDRPLPQQQLANDLANLVFSVRQQCVVSWLRGFWAVMGAQWTDIDVLRMEKFLLLVRRVFAAQLRWVKGQEYTGQNVDEVLEHILKNYCFEEEGDLRKVPVGIRLHVLDLWVDELEREGLIGEEVENGEAAEEFVKKIGVLVEALRVSIVKPVRERARESYDDERLPWGTTKAGDDDAAEEDDEWGGLDD